MASPEVAAQLRLIQGLQHRALRDRKQLCYVEGVRFLMRAVESGAEIHSLVVSWKLLISTPARQAVRRLRRDGTRCVLVSPEQFRQISSQKRASGVGLVLRQRWTDIGDLPPRPQASWLLLRECQTSGNLGTLLRSLAAVGGDGLILLGDEVDAFDPVVVRATMGAIFSLRLVRATPEEFARHKAEKGFDVVGSSPAAELDYSELRQRPGAIIFLGGERKGLSGEDLALCDRLVRIPMTGQVDSLNLGVAGSILLYEARRFTH